MTVLVSRLFICNYNNFQKFRLNFLKIVFLIIKNEQKIYDKKCNFSSEKMRVQAQQAG